MTQPEPNGGRIRKFGAVLGSLSVATIITLYLTVGQQQSPPQQPTTNDNGTTTAANIYPANVQTDFINSCEANGSSQICECSLAWFKQHVPMPRFQQDEAAAEQGLMPADFVSVESACG